MIGIAHAANHVDAANSFVDTVNEVILFPLISLLLGVAVLVFLWGVFQFVANAESEDARSTGKKHMLFGIIGIVIMVSALAILQVAANTFGVSVPQ